jgi:hypothetical protein
MAPFRGRLGSEGARRRPQHVKRLSGNKNRTGARTENTRVLGRRAAISLLFAEASWAKLDDSVCCAGMLSWAVLSAAHP